MLHFQFCFFCPVCFLRLSQLIGGTAGADQLSPEQLIDRRTWIPEEENGQDEAELLQTVQLDVMGLGFRSVTIGGSSRI